MISGLILRVDDTIYKMVCELYDTNSLPYDLKCKCIRMEAGLFHMSPK